MFWSAVSITALVFVFGNRLSSKAKTKAAMLAALHNSIAHAEGHEHVDFLHVALLLQDIAPGVGPLRAQAPVEEAAAVRHLEIGVGRSIETAEHVGAVA